MRLITLLLLLILSVGCTSPKHATSKPGNLDGTWVPVKQEMGGAALPNAVFEKQKLILLDSTYTFIAESTDKGVVKYSGNKMDIFGREGVNAGKHFTAIHKYENELLTICYNLSGESYPESFDTKGKPGYFLAVFKKELAK